jgi:DNA-binding CsgD family transcriptional regulator
MISRQGLSALQTQIVQLLADGLTTKEISLAVARSAPTIESHIRLLYARLDARSRAQLVARAIAAEIIIVKPASYQFYQ